MNDTNFSLIDLKAFSDPAVKLIEAVKSAAGIIYEPTQIRRKAKAKADEAIILAKSQIEVQEIEIRASERLKNKEIRRQNNIEKITKMAIEALPDSVSEEEVDKDWIYTFFDHCQDINNEQMQSLWAKLLAGEVTKPRSFSLRTLRLVKDLQKDDAHLFTKLCTFVWTILEHGFTPLIHNYQLDYFTKAGINFPVLQHLESLGLIFFNHLVDFHFKDFSKASCFYYGKLHKVYSLDSKKTLELGSVLLTSIGKELAPIAGSEPNEDYRIYVVEELRRQGFKVDV